jgi:succinyl-diaminopimelate desuccinylase
MTVDEETGGFTGLGFLVEEGYVSLENTDYCVYTECFGSSRICLGHRGVLKFHVTATGKTAHGCLAHDGRNAITAMNDFLTRIERYRERLHGRTTDQPVTPVESRRADVSATMLDAGYSENVVPDRCRATFYRVLVPGETADGAREEIRALMRETEDAVDTSLSYDEIMYAEPTVVSEECTVARTYAEHVREFHGQPEFVVSPGSDDQRFVVNDAGIEECIVYGPGQLDQAHVVDESVPIEEVLTAAKVMAVSTADLMGVLET